ncbi:aldehyde ferredoxin oxidoreductase [Candidatus Bathyarchaeota archaeon]|nr:MAG: aldehyde ferredoxin oxidoreductase [Candidatus Bathyarchaeota archaeon]
MELRDAKDYWGMGGLEVQESLRRDLGDSSIKVASIGPAGENCVPIACVNCDWRNAGRTGMGAVMGSKHLKAIAVRGSLDIPVADPEALYKEAEGAFAHVRDHEFARTLRKYGLAWYIDWAHENSCLPVMNFRRTTYEGREGINADAMLARVVTATTACPRCPMCCGKFSYVRSGRYAGTAIDGPEYETIAMIGANCCLPSIEDVVYANWLCDNLGMDTISAGNIVAFAIECYERGIIGPEDTGGLELRYGDPDCVFKLLELMAKREGIGDVLARGVKFAAEKFGKGAEKFAMHVKGLEQSAYDVRAAPAMGLAYATADIGAHHNRAWAITYDMEVGRDKYTRDKAERVIFLQHARPLFDCLGVCRLHWVETGLPLDYYARAFKAATGVEVSVEELLRASERIFNLTRAINVRRGLTSAEDRLPDRVFEYPVPNGVAKGYKLDKAKFQELLRAYYELRGWDERGVPTRAKLEELGLADVADALGL